MAARWRREHQCRRWMGAWAGMLGMAGAVVARAADPGWDELAFGKVSGRLQEIEHSLAQIAPELDKLPAIPIDDQGGTGGHASIHPQATPPAGSQYAVELRWPVVAAVGMVALVPARRYDANGLNAQYGMPDLFNVDLIDAEGKVLRHVATERHARAHPVRRGHPFVYQVDPPVAAAGLRLVADQLHRNSDGEENYVHAWAEVFAFAEERNVALGCEVKYLGGSAPAAPWHWHPSFLVDGQTPLGLPETTGENHRNIGWISEGRAKANQRAALTVDLGASESITALRLIPAKRPTSDLPSGFGFPRKLLVRVAATADEPDHGVVVAEREFLNPGHNPVWLGVEPVRGRYVRIEATELWKAYDHYPAFFALSEVEVLDGDRNVALNQVVRSADGMLNLIVPGDRSWNSASLTDGFGPDGRLVPTRAWLMQLQQRLLLETRRHELRQEAERLVGGWRRTKVTALTVLGLLGAFFVIVLPIRYRIHAKRDLMKVRERIAGDLHDEVGSNLGSIQMFADLAEGRSGPSEDLKRIQRIAAETVSAVRDIVWLLRPQGEHRIGTVEHLRETSSIMLESLEWKFHANEEAWQVELGDEATRHLFLFFRESLHNIMRHAKASKVEVRIDATHDHLRLTIADDGAGIAPERMARPATLRALRQRAGALGAEFAVDSQAGEGTRLVLVVPRRRVKNRREPRRVAPP